MKHEWRKAEKHIYLPKKNPELISLSRYKYFTITGEGNPGGDEFPEYIAALYALSYALKMGLKKRAQPKGYVDYAVYPLEGVWDINHEAKKTFDGTFSKDDLLYKLMIRQPDFIQDDLAEQVVQQCKAKKPNVLFEKVKFEQIEEGNCVQMLHLGSYDNEPATFKIMEEFAIEHNLHRITKVHKEIYLSDARKVAPEKLKTVLRFQVMKK